MTEMASKSKAAAPLGSIFRRPIMHAKDLKIPVITTLRGAGPAAKLRTEGIEGNGSSEKRFIPKHNRARLLNLFDA